MSPIWAPNLSPWVGGGASGGGAEPGPDPEPEYEAFALTASPNGGNNPWTVPGALQHDGIAYVTWIDNSGAVEGAHYDEATGTTSGVFTIHSNFEDDAHSSPAICRRASDGRFVVVYAKHNSTPINLRLSTNADSLNGWGAPTNLDGQLGGSRYSNYQIFERDDTLWMVDREEFTAGTQSSWVIMSCDSSTPTSGWTAEALVYRLTSTRSYVITHYDPVLDRLHFIATAGANTGFTKVGHFYRDMADGTNHKSDGTALAAQITSFASITEIHSGGGPAFGVMLTCDSSGHPVVAIWDDLDYHYVRYDGSTWADTFLANCGVGYEYGGPGTGFQAWGMAVDDGDPDVVWLLIDDDGVNPQLWRYVTDDGGATFTPTQITDDLTGDQTQIICVRNPDKLRAFWMSGTWTYWNNGDWTMGLRGVRSA